MVPNLLSPSYNGMIIYVLLFYPVDHATVIGSIGSVSSHTMPLQE
jgi:hypothetical protein